MIIGIGLLLLYSHIPTGQNYTHVGTPKIKSSPSQAFDQVGYPVESWGFTIHNCRSKKRLLRRPGKGLARSADATAELEEERPRLRLFPPMPHLPRRQRVPTVAAQGRYSVLLWDLHYWHDISQYTRGRYIKISLPYKQTIFAIKMPRMIWFLQKSSLYRLYPFSGYPIIVLSRPQLSTNVFGAPITFQNGFLHWENC